MTKYIGRLINVGFGKESVRGTVVAPTSWNPKTSFDFEEKIESIQDESSIGVIGDNIGSHVTKRWAEGNIEGNVGVEQIGLLLLNVFGGVSSAGASTGAYQHDFSVVNTNQHQSLSIGTDDPVQDYSFANGMIESITINAEVGAFATYSVTFKAKAGEAATHTATYTTDYKLLAKDGSFKIASDLAGLAGATAKCIKSFEVTISKNLEDDQCLGSVGINDFLNKQFSVEGSFTALFENETDYKTNALNGTNQAIRLSLTDTDTTIGASDNPTLEFDLAKAAMTEFASSKGNDEIVSQTLTFKGAYSQADASMITSKLINTTTSY